MLKTLNNTTQTLATIGAPANGAAISLLRAKTFSAQCNITVNTPAAKTFADGTVQVQTVATANDVSGSLNSKYFTLNSINTTTGALKGFYVWFNINSAGVDPAVPGKTAIPITGATNVTAATLATSIRSALNALTGDFAATGSSANVIITNVNPGLVAAAADGTAATNFTFNAPSTPGVNSAVNPVLNTITITSHGYSTGLIVQGTSTGTLPGGLSTSTNYYAVIVDANTIKLASSLANAQAGTAIDITDYGSNTSTGTFTATALATGTVQLNKSDDNVNWVTEGSTVSVTATGSYWLEKVDPTALYMRVAYSLASGSFSSNTVILIQGEIP